MLLAADILLLLEILAVIPNRSISISINYM